MKLFVFLLLFAIAVFAFVSYHAPTVAKQSVDDSLLHELYETAPTPSAKNISLHTPSAVIVVNNDVTFIDSLITFAESQVGIPYHYGSADPKAGFDCSGFITYVFNHFKITVPRSSRDFKDEGITIPLKNSRRGDLILFTGTDTSERIIGHMGIVVSNNTEGLTFIHSTSGKAYGVVNTALNDYYRNRFIKVIRIIK